MPYTVDSIYNSIIHIADVPLSNRFTRRLRSILETVLEGNNNRGVEWITDGTTPAVLPHAVDGGKWISRSLPLLFVDPHGNTNTGRYQSKPYTPTAFGSDSTERVWEWASITGTTYKVRNLIRPVVWAYLPRYEQAHPNEVSYSYTYATAPPPSLTYTGPTMPAMEWPSLDSTSINRVIERLSGAGTLVQYVDYPLHPNPVPVDADAQTQGQRAYGVYTADYGAVEERVLSGMVTQDQAHNDNAQQRANTALDYNYGSTASIRT